MTRVKLGPPASGPGAQEHLRQMAEDAADVVAERNLQELTSFGLKRWGRLGLLARVLG